MCSYCIQVIKYAKISWWLEQCRLLRRCPLLGVFVKKELAVFTKLLLYSRPLLIQIASGWSPFQVKISDSLLLLCTRVWLLYTLFLQLCSEGSQL